MESLIEPDYIERRILLIRRHRVMTDATLAFLYGVSTKRLNEQVRRNRERFPSDFMFTLTSEEERILRAHSFAAAKPGRGGRRYSSMVFTEHGALMLASVLNSPIAVQTSVKVVRAFVRLREMLTANKDLSRRLDALESRYDSQFKTVFDAIRELMSPPADPPKRIGFHP
ncbi:MAG: ORF6N domain-containing protein [Elusimicrobiota bacterium]|jgi:hypothetical protein